MWSVHGLEYGQPLVDGSHHRGISKERPAVGEGEMPGGHREEDIEGRDDAEGALGEPFREPEREPCLTFGAPAGTLTTAVSRRQ